MAGNGEFLPTIYGDGLGMVFYCHTHIILSGFCKVESCVDVLGFIWLVHIVYLCVSHVIFQ